MKLSEIFIEVRKRVEKTGHGLHLNYFTCNALLWMVNDGLITEEERAAAFDRFSRWCPYPLQPDRSWFPNKAARLDAINQTIEELLLEGK